MNLHHGNVHMPKRLSQFVFLSRQASNSQWFSVFLSGNYLSMINTSLLIGAPYTTSGFYRGSLFVLYLILTWQQRQLKLLKQPRHDHSSLKLRKCLSNTESWTHGKREISRSRGIAWIIGFRGKPIWIRPLRLGLKHWKPVYHEPAKANYSLRGDEMASKILHFC